MSIKSSMPVFASATLLLSFAAGSSASVLVYEGFQYDNVGAELIGLPDDPGVGDVAPIGLTGAWADASASTGSSINDMFIKSGNLSFSNLNSNGNHIGFSSNSNSDRYHNGLDLTATSAIQNAGSANDKIYFSFLFEKLQSRFSADREGFALTNVILPHARWDGGNNPGAVGTHGFAVAATNNTNLRAIAYDGTTTRIVGDSTLPTPAANGGSNTSGSNLSNGDFVRLVVGEISFNTGTDGKDVFKLYNVTDDGSVDAADLVLIDTIEANVDESLLNTLLLTRQVNVNYDEVRIATTLDEALGVPEPGSLALLGLGGLLIASRRKR